MATDAALGRAIRLRREDRGLSQGQFAELVGLTPFVVGRIEAGARSLKAVELESFARHLNTDVESLLSHGQPPDPGDLTVWALERRDVAQGAIHDYARAVAEAARAYVDAPSGALLPDGTKLSDVTALIEHLRSTRVRLVPVPVDEELAPVIQRAVADVADGPWSEPLR